MTGLAHRCRPPLQRGPMRVPASRDAGRGVNAAETSVVSSLFLWVAAGDCGVRRLDAAFQKPLGAFVPTGLGKAVGCPSDSAATALQEKHRTYKHKLEAALVLWRRRANHHPRTAADQSQRRDPARDGGTAHPALVRDAPRRPSASDPRPAGPGPSRAPGPADMGQEHCTIGIAM